MRIVLIVEGRTEDAFLPALRAFVNKRITGRPPRLETSRCDGPLPKDHELKRLVRRLLDDDANAVIALTDVRPDFDGARDAKEKMSRWVGQEPRFHPHAAQYDFEAWLLPFWEEIKRITGCTRSSPGNNPERVNHTHPPVERIRDAFRTGTRTKGRHSYSKTRDAKRILEGKDLTIAADRCVELKAFLNTILTVSGAPPIS